VIGEATHAKFIAFRFTRQTPHPCDNIRIYSKTI